MENTRETTILGLGALEVLSSFAVSGGPEQAATMLAGPGGPMEGSKGL